MIFEIRNISLMQFTSQFILIIYYTFHWDTRINIDPSLQFIKTIQLIHSSPSHLNNGLGNKLLFRYERTKEVALHNAIILDCYNFNIDLAIQAQKNSPVIYGSEFWHISNLSKLLNRHHYGVRHRKSLKMEPLFPFFQFQMTSAKQI